MKVWAFDDGFDIYIRREELEKAIQNHNTLEKFKDFIINRICNAQFNYLKTKIEEIGESKMTLEKVLERIDFEKNWLMRDYRASYHDLDIAFSCIKYDVIKFAEEMSPKEEAKEGGAE